MADHTKVIIKKTRCRAAVRIRTRYRQNARKDDAPKMEALYAGRPAPLSQLRWHAIVERPTPTYLRRAIAEADAMRRQQIAGLRHAIAREREHACGVSPRRSLLPRLTRERCGEDGLHHSILA